MSSGAKLVGEMEGRNHQGLKAQEIAELLGVSVTWWFSEKTDYSADIDSAKPVGVPSGRQSISRSSTFS